jgi:nucleotide-binding universal stress UspA family protein
MQQLHFFVPTAGTPHCLSAVRLGARLASRYNGQLTLLTVIRRRSQQEQGETILQKSIRMAEKEGVKPAANVRVGQPAKVIVTAAAAANADLIVMGSRPWHNRLRSLLGSTSQAVITRASCPVLVAKGDAPAPESMLVCDSGAVSPRMVKRLVQSLPFLLHSQRRITILHVMSQMSAGPGVMGWELRADADELVEAHTPEGELLISDAELLQKTGIQPTVKIRHGLVVEEIMTEAMDGDYELVAIGAHQHGGWQELLLDDLQQQIIACLDRSVLVVH